MSINYTWQPASKPDNDGLNLNIVAAEGSHIITQDGKRIYDAISSWWCKPLGHSHRLVSSSIKKQLQKFEHHIPVNASNIIIEELSKRLIHIFTTMDKVMYASDGSSAVEIAMKLSYETRIIQQQPNRYKFIALSGAYHGETIFTLGVCGIDLYKKNYNALLQQNYFINHITYVSGVDDPLWSDCKFDLAYWQDFFTKAAPDSTALIIEPIVQGAAGMKIISRDFLIKLIQLAKQYDLHIISDEIMVGLGRLGCHSVSKEILNIEPDLVCFAKNLTAGSIPMSAVVVNRSISDQFRQSNQIFPHSHTHSCNSLAAAVAVHYLKLLAESDILHQVKLAETSFKELLNNLCNEFIFLENPRVIGSIAAIDLNLSKEILKKIFKLGIDEKIYIRPISNTLYLMPPLYNIMEDIQEIKIKLYAILQKIAMAYM